jgi:hypothetical protein
MFYRTYAARYTQEWVTLSQFVPAGQSASEPLECAVAAAKPAGTPTSSATAAISDANRRRQIACMSIPFG